MHCSGANAEVELELPVSDYVRRLQEIVETQTGVAPAHQHLSWEKVLLHAELRDGNSKRIRDARWSDFELPSRCHLILTNLQPLYGRKLCQMDNEELRGITVRQLARLRDFAESQRLRWKDSEKELIFPEPFTVQQVVDRVVEPATFQKRCSYVELCSSRASAQWPKWFVSHWWGQGMAGLVDCLQAHTQARGLLPRCAYWLSFCAKRNHQSQTQVVQGRRPNCDWLSGLSQAMRRCDGLLLAVDETGRVFSRTWCLYEAGLASGRTSVRGPLLLDVAVESNGEGRPGGVVTDGLNQSEEVAERSRGDCTGWGMKLHRERDFPLQVLLRGLKAELSTSEASNEQERRQLLNRLARKGPQHLASAPPSHHQSWDRVVQRLRGALAAVSLPLALSLPPWGTADSDLAALQSALRHDQARTHLKLGLKSEHGNESLLRRTALALPPGLEELMLVVRGGGPLTGAGLPKLAEMLPRGLQRLVLDISDLRGVQESGLRFLAKEIGQRRSLKHLGLELAETKVTDAVLQELAAALPAGLESLRLGCGRLRPVDKEVRLTDVGLSSLACKLPAGLRSLSMDLTSSWVTDVGLQAVARDMPPGLVTLDIELEGSFVHTKLKNLTRSPSDLQRVLQACDNREPSTSPRSSVRKERLQEPAEAAEASSPPAAARQLAASCSGFSSRAKAVAAAGELAPYTYANLEEDLAAEAQALARWQQKPHQSGGGYMSARESSSLLGPERAYQEELEARSAAERFLAGVAARVLASRSLEQALLEAAKERGLSAAADASDGSGGLELCLPEEQELPEPPENLQMPPGPLETLPEAQPLEAEQVELLVEGGQEETLVLRRPVSAQPSPSPNRMKRQLRPATAGVCGAGARPGTALRLQRPVPKARPASAPAPSSFNRPMTRWSGRVGASRPCTPRQIQIERAAAEQKRPASASNPSAMVLACNRLMRAGAELEEWRPPSVPADSDLQRSYDDLKAKWRGRQLILLDAEREKRLEQVATGCPLSPPSLPEQRHQLDHEEGSPTPSLVEQLRQLCVRLEPEPEPPLAAKVGWKTARQRVHALVRLFGNTADDRAEEAPARVPWRSSGRHVNVAPMHLYISHEPEAVCELRDVATSLQMPMQNILLAKKLFDSFDADHDGHLSDAELKGALEEILRATGLRKDLALQQMAALRWKSLVHKEGKNRGGDLRSFLTIYWKAMQSGLSMDKVNEAAKALDLPLECVRELKQNWDALDNDGSGSLDLSGFSELLARGLKVPPHQELPLSRVQHFWAELTMASKSRNRVTFEEVLRWWVRTFGIRTLCPAASDDEVPPFEDFYRRLCQKSPDPPVGRQPQVRVDSSE